MTDVFISYARTNKEAVYGLRDALLAQPRLDGTGDSLSIWIDAEDIELSSDWWERISKGIRETNNFVVMLTNDYLGSEICNRELTYARELGKKISAVWLAPAKVDEYRAIQNRRQQTDEHWINMALSQADANYDYLKSINGIPYTPNNLRQTSYQIAQAIFEDLAHKDTATRLQIRALEWQKTGQNPSYLLRGHQLAEAKRWLAEARQKPTIQPAIQSEHRQYIEASQQAQRRRQFSTSAGIVVALGIIVGLAYLAITFLAQSEASQGEADTQSTQAAIESRASDVTRSERLAFAARNVHEDDVLFAHALANEALQVDNPPLEVERMLAELAYKPGIQQVISLPTENNDIQAISADGQRAITETENEFILWDVANGQQTYTFAGDFVAFNKDGSSVVGKAEDGTLTWWDSTTGTELRTFDNYGGADLVVTLNDDHSLLVTSSPNNTLVLWDVANHQQLGSFTGTLRAFSPDNTKLIYETVDETLTLWDIANQTEIYTFSPHANGMNTALFSPDGSQFMTAACPNNDDRECRSGEMFLWDTQTGDLVRTFPGISWEVTSAEFSTDGAFLATASCNEINVLRCANGVVLIWEVARGDLLYTLSASSLRDSHEVEQYINQIHFSSDDSQIITQKRDYIIFWDLGKKLILNKLIGELPVEDMTISPDGTHLLAVYGEALTLWNLRTGQVEYTLSNTNDSRLDSGVFSPDGMLMATSDWAGNIAIRDTSIGEPQLTLTSDFTSLAFTSIDFSPDGSQIVGGSPQRLMYLWDIMTEEIIQDFVGHTHEIYDVEFSPDGTLIASASCLTKTTDDKCEQGVIYFWNPETGEQIRVLEGHSDLVICLAFNSDGSQLISGANDGSLILWDTATGEQIREFDSHINSVSSVAFSPDDTRIVSGSWDYLVVLWDVASGQQLRQFVGHTYWVGDVVFSPDGKRVISGSGDRSVIVWQLDSQEDLSLWLRENRYIRELTCEERDIYQIDPYCQ